MPGTLDDPIYIDLLSEQEFKDLCAENPELTEDELKTSVVQQLFIELREKAIETVGERHALDS